MLTRLMHRIVTQFSCMKVTRVEKAGFQVYNLDYMLPLKVTTVGKSAGFILPKEAMTRMKLKKGDIVFLTETREGYLLTPYDPEFEAQMEIAQEGMRRYRNALRELAR